MSISNSASGITLYGSPLSVAGGGTGGGSVIAAQNALSIKRGYTINSIGDSLSALSFYQPTTLPSYAPVPPQWLASTAYIVGNTVTNNGVYYRCKVQGTSAGSGGPTGTNATITDNTVTWQYMPPQAEKGARELLFWIEAWSLGELVWDQSQGYGGTQRGLLKVLVQSGGTSYAPTDTVTFTGGATGNLVVNGGVIVAVNVTNPGYTVGNSIAATINTSTGSGAILSLIQSPAGTFGIPGGQASDSLLALPDAIASTVDIFTVMVGTNDVISATPYTTTIANLKAIYEGLVNAGRTVIAIPIFPRDTSITTGAQNLKLQRINRWIRAYYRKESWANPLGTNILIADNTRYMTDGTSTTDSPIGAAAAGVGAMTVDGLHQTERGAQYLALGVINALATIMGTLNTTTFRVAGPADGYDPLLNPGGNALEGYPWTAATAYVAGSHVSNDTAPVKIYACTAAGTSAGSGGPTGTGTAITDGTVTWRYLYSLGASVFQQTYDATPTAASGVVFTGSIPHNMSMQRLGGSAAGTVITTKENPWSDGQVGQRMSMAFSLGSGTNVEQWALWLGPSSPANAFGIPTSELGVGFYYVEAEVELTNVANMSFISLGLTDDFSNGGTFQTETGRDMAQGSGGNFGMMNSSGEMLPYPNSGKMMLRSQPMLLPTNIASVYLMFWMQFNASGAANSATATIKFNYWALRKAFVA